MPLRCAYAASLLSGVMTEKQPVKSVRLQMVISPEEIQQVDDWRRQQTDLPSRSEAIRRLIQLGLMNVSAKR